MKQYTLSQFKTLINDTNWSSEQEIEKLDTVQRSRTEYDEELEEPVEVEYDHTFGQAKLVSTHLTENISIAFHESYTYDNCEPDTFNHSPEGLDTVWSFEGFEVIDVDGNVKHILDLVYDLPSSFSDIDYSEVTDQIEETVLVDQGRQLQSDFEDICVLVDNNPNLLFFGKIIGESSSYHYSNRNDKWTELKLYKTKSGLYVCSQVFKTRWIGQRTSHKGQVCKSLDEVKDFFGYGWLAKELYENADIDASQRIE